MGGFNTSESNKQATNYSNAQNYSQNDAENYSVNSAVNQATNQTFNQAGQQATSATQLYGGQAPFLRELWGQGAALSGADPGVAAQARGAWGQALGGGINPGVADVIANASADMGLSFSRNTLPGIRQGAVGTGSLGGSRQGIAEGLAAGELARNQSNMATTLYTQALDQASRERTAALSMSGAMQNLPWQGLESFARVLGGPVMESQGQSFGASSGGAYGQSSGSSYGQTSGRSGGVSSGFANSYGVDVGASDAMGMSILSKGNTAAAPRLP